MRSTTIMTSLALALALPAGRTSVATADDARVDGAQVLDERFAAAFVADDLDALVDLYAEDGVLFNIGGPPAVGREQIRGALAGFLGAFDVLEFHHGAQHYETSGNLSAGWAQFAITVVSRAGGPSFVIEGRSTTVAERIDGDWYYVHDHASLPAQ